MIDKKFENIRVPVTIATRVQSPGKNENFIYQQVNPSLENSRRIIKSNSIYPNQQHLHLVHGNWMSSTGQPFPNRILSPNTAIINLQPGNNRRSDIIELGGSK